MEKIMCSLTDYLDDQRFNQLQNDSRVVTYKDDYVFCKENDVKDLENEYDLEFCDSASTLFNIFLEEFEVDERSLLDMRYQFKDKINFCGLEFENLLSQSRNYFKELLECLIKDYNGMKKRYLNQLRYLSGL